MGITANLEFCAWGCMWANFIGAGSASGAMSLGAFFIPRGGGGDFIHVDNFGENVDNYVVIVDNYVDNFWAVSPVFIA